jgi:hypothetical protein
LSWSICFYKTGFKPHFSYLAGALLAGQGLSNDLETNMKKTNGSIFVAKFCAARDFIELQRRSNLDHRAFTLESSRLRSIITTNSRKDVSQGTPKSEQNNENGDLDEKNEGDQDHNSHISIRSESFSKRREG